MSSDIRTKQHAAYAAVRFVLADRLKVIAGARHQVWETNYFYIWDSPDGGFVYDHTNTTPYAGLVYDVGRRISAFVSATEIFKPQNDRGVDGRYLDPIDGRSVDFGIKSEHFDRRLTTALTLFDTRQDNVAEPVVDELGQPVLLPDLTQASQPIDGTRSRGFEVDVAGELKRGWNASLGWSRYILEDAGGEAVNSHIPRTMLRLFTSWTPARDGRFTLGGGLSWQSESTAFVGSPAGGATLVQGDVTLVSLLARYNVSDKISVQLNGENLLDERYYVLDNYDNTYYGPPANYSASVNVRF